MPRKPRFYVPDIPVHVVQRGNDRQAVFYDDADYQAYLRWLQEGARRYGNAIHAYVLMTNHVHLLVSPGDKDSLMRMMQYLGRHYVMYVNHTYGRTGTLWEGRYKASLVQEEAYLLTCYRYVELNPVRADMVKGPGQYRWSSYRHNALGKKDPVVTPHRLYNALSRSESERRARYRALFKAHVDEEQLKTIRAAWRTGTPLGNERFREQIESVVGRKVGQARRGRPRKKENER